MAKQSIDLDEKREELSARRRDIIRRLFYLGNKLPAIISAGDKNNIFPPLFTWHQKVKMVEEDLKAIHREDREALSVSLEDQKEAQQAYIVRQEFLYGLALEVKDVAQAAALSKDIARAQGVVTDQPIQVKTDLADILMNAMNNRKKGLIEEDEKPKIEEKKAISLLPEQFRVVKEAVPVTKEGE